MVTRLGLSLHTQRKLLLCFLQLAFGHLRFHSELSTLNPPLLTLQLLFYFHLQGMGRGRGEEGVFHLFQICLLVIFDVVKLQI